MPQISKKDWKLYREKLPQRQERYMEGLIQEYIDFLSDEDIQASTKFWELRERIKNDRRHPGVLVEVRKSTAMDIIFRMIQLKVISKDDLNDFSSELKQEIERLIAFYR